MADTKISALTASTTPLAGTEVLPIVQSSTTKQVSVANLTAGRAVGASSITLSSLTSGRVPYATTSGLLTDSANLQFSGSNLGVGYTPNTWYTTFNVIQFGGYGSSVFGRSENSSAGLTSNAYLNSGGSWKYINSSFASYYQQLNGQHQWYTAASGTAGNDITFTTSMTLDTSSNLTLNTGNLVIGTSGKGIDFSATSGTGTSELLADYEEGTWTPVLRFATTNQTITIPIATYVKVGKSVTVNMQVTWAAKSGSGVVNITGLPFAKEAGGTVPLLAGCPAGSVTTLAALFYNVDGGGTVLNLAEQAGDINSASLAAAGSLFCSGTYFV
jgi:hypothetical protein